MSGFLKVSKEIAEDFLQTAVFLDDKLYSRDDSESVPPKEGVMEPVGYAAESKKGFKDSDDKHSGAGYSGATSGKDVSDDSDSNPLNAEIIVNAFMEKGIVCSVIKCGKDDFDTKKGDINNNKYIRLIKKADIAVLDWDLYGDYGGAVLEIIKGITGSDDKLHELRLIVIYTDNDLGSVKKSISELDLGFEPANATEGYILHNKYTTVSLFSKPGGKTAVKERTVAQDSLANKCTEEFTSVFSGIVPNVAMSAVSEIRKNTHKLLGVLNKELDIAYLSHRALLPFPEDAEPHIEDIVADEIRSVISGNETGKKSCYENIKDYRGIQDKFYECIDGFKIDFPLFIGVGADKLLCDAQKKEFEKQCKDCFTKEWYPCEEKSRCSEKLFAIVSSIQTDYKKDGKKYLTLGVVIERESDGIKFLCMQPECDSVRLDKNQKVEFIFLKLKQSAEGFDLIFEDGCKYEVNYGRRFRKNLTFKTSENEVVESDAEQKFVEANKDSKVSVKYKYICSLKKSHAQRIANELGSYISRVGLNESEYIRRNKHRNR